MKTLEWEQRVTVNRKTNSEMFAVQSTTLIKSINQTQKRGNYSGKQIKLFENYKLKQYAAEQLPSVPIDFQCKSLIKFIL